MKTVCKKLLSLMLVAMLLVSAVPFQVLAAEVESTESIIATEAVVAAAEEVTATTEEVVAVAEEVVVAEEETVAEPVAENAQVSGNTANQPATSSMGDIVTVQYLVNVDGIDCVVKEYTNQKAGGPFPADPGAAAALKVYAQYAGSSAGKKFQQWELDGAKFTPSGKYIPAVNGSGTVIMVYAKIVDAPQKITLNAMGGSLSKNSHEVTIGQPYGTLPTPTREHYNFLYWYKLVNGIEVPINGDHIVEDTSSLNAKWELKAYDVTFEAHDGFDWTPVKTVTVPARSTLTVAAGTFPSDADIATAFNLPGFSIVGWEILDTDVAFTAGSTKINTNNVTLRPRYQRTVTLQANNPISNASWSTKSITVEVGEPIGVLPNPGARDSWTFSRWLAEDHATEICTLANLNTIAAHPLYTPAMGATFYADYVNSMVVYLYIHTNGNTQTATKIVPYYQAPATGIFDMTLINMYSIFSDYGNFDDTVDASYGWYTPDQWANYCTNKAANPAMYYEDIEANKYGEFHIMLINGGNSSAGSNNNGGFTGGNSYNNNAATADPSNPTTGDMIMMAVTVLAVSGAALALVFFVSKKRKA